ncbi:GTPase [Falsirhodobacter xinxiangensis]|uniref:GTPase n=1 Tax=Falsirhodobacter xinxiangensis TaxID=2530049 RepID=UPI0010A9ED46|nr:GTPase [Rhodobacter xinxiangensis]
MIRLLRARMLRWQGVLAFIVLAAPWVVCIGLGILWLRDNGLMLHFVMGSAALSLMVAGIRWLPRRKGREAIAAQARQNAVAPDADWLPREVEIFEAARARIANRVTRPLPWPMMAAESLDTVRDVARRFGHSGELDFTLPEALLLVERATSRYRSHVKQMVPFADTVRISTLFWIWQRREALGWAGKGYRVFRMLTNAPAAIAAEIQGIASGGSTSWLTAQMEAVAQIVLLEEIAFAATELYSGRLKFSDTELLEIGLASTDADRSRLATPDAPLRIVVVGQTSAGKSSVINALLGRSWAGTDLAPTTAALTTYEAVLAGMPCHLVDTPGIDGEASRAAALAEMVDADMIIWPVRSNRAGRAEDVRLMAAFEAHFAALSDRRRPEVVLVATCVDLLVPCPPKGRGATRTIADAVATIGADLSGHPIPVSLSGEGWNLTTLRPTVESGLAGALMVQRNRQRLAAPKGVLGRIADEGRNASAGSAKLATVLWKRLSPFGGSSVLTEKDTTI